ncbi:PilZ domain-containing protein [Metabacillus sp. 84]|uniref:PilZ domain-containing protein n=1 Tax=unclassified Metabacillus TaxID=2675274 RepID=UPI003CF9C629
MEYITIVTKDHRTLTAGLHEIKGELMNVVVKDKTGISLGDKLTCKYNQQSFHAYVLKQEEFNLYLYLPLQERKAPNERRRFYRHPCQLNGVITSEAGPERKVTIIDLSFNGFGFISTRPLTMNEAYSLQIFAGEEVIHARISIQNTMTLPSSLYRCGSQIQFLSKENLFLLRKYIINEQLNENG